MSGPFKPSTADGRLQEVFGASVAELSERARSADVPPAVRRALELRSFLALTEMQVARVRDRVHHAMAPGRDMNELSPDGLRMDAQWLDAAVSARLKYRSALNDLLRTMPPPSGSQRPVQVTQHKITTSLPPAVGAPAPQRAGASRIHRGRGL